MDGNLDEIKTSYTDKLKRLKLLEAGVKYDDVDNYVKYIKSEDEGEIEKEAQMLVADIKQQDTATNLSINKSVWKPF